METEKETATIRVNATDKAIWDKFLKRTHSIGTDSFGQIMKQLDLLMDLMSPEGKLLWIASIEHSGSNRFIIIRLSDNISFGGISSLPAELQSEVEKAFDYGRGLNGELIDLRDKQPQQSPTVEPEKPKRKSFCEQLNEQHEQEIKEDKENNLT